MAVASDWRTLYPFESHYYAVEPSIRMHYLDESGPNAARDETLLMVHGNPTWSFYWRNLASAFRATHRVVVPDHIGCGLSDKPQDYPYTLERRIEDLVGLIDHLDLGNLTVIVHDWGGAIGLGAALRRADRVRRLVLFNTGAFPPPFVPLRIRLCRTPGIGTWAMRGLNLFARAALTMAVEKPLAAEVRAGLIAPYDSWQHRVAVDRFVHDIPFTTKHPTWHTLQWLESNLPQLADRPVQMIWGMRDWCFDPRCLRRLQQTFPDAEVHELADAGHYVVEDASERIVPLMQAFLARDPDAVDATGRTAGHSNPRAPGGESTAGTRPSE